MTEEQKTQLTVEYKLIKEKKSLLSANERNKVVQMFELAVARGIITTGKDAILEGEMASLRKAQNGITQSDIVDE